MGHLLACRLITILMDWDCSDSSACMTLTGGEGGRAEKAEVKAVLEEGAYWRKKRTTFGFNHNTAENVASLIFSAVLSNPPDAIRVNRQDLDSSFLDLTRGSSHYKSTFTHSNSHAEDREMTSYHDFRNTHLFISRTLAMPPQGVFWVQGSRLHGCVESGVRAVVTGATTNWASASSFVPSAARVAADYRAHRKQIAGFIT